MLKKILKITAIILLLPYLMVPVYAIIPPISLPIIGQTLLLEDVHWRWRSYDKISKTLPRAIIVAEDSRFCEHNGVDWESLEKVISAAEKRGKLTRGASTIAMQTAKNLFLWVYPDLLRKPMEIPLAMWIDFVWSKKRVIEVYMNIAEMGNGIYGAEAVAQAHFGKPATKLSGYEASLIAASLPNPIKRNSGKPSGYTKSYAADILAKAPAAMMGCLRK